MTAVIQPSLAHGQADEGTPTPRRRRRANSQPVPPVWLVLKPDPGDLGLVDELIEARASNPTQRLFRYLGRACLRYKAPCTWERQCTIATLLGVSPATVSDSFAWLEAHGFVARSQELIDGRIRTVIWCLWAFRRDLSGAGSAGDNQSFSHAQVVQNPEAGSLQNFESKDCLGSSLRESSKTTTDGGRLSFSRVEEEEPQKPEPKVEYVPETPAAVMPPSSAIAEPDPKVPPASAELPEVLRAELLAVADLPRSSAKVAAEALKWVGRVELDWIRLAILEFIAKSRLVDDPKPIVTADGWFRGMLETWEEKKQPQPVLARAAIEAQAKQTRLAEQAERDRSAAEAKRLDAARQRSVEQIRERWKALPEAEKLALRAEFEQVEPRQFGPAQRLWEIRREWWCADVFAAREVAR